jgi:ABC-type dipeptide/oligopeptide/nickel transport system permease subunit
VLTIRRLEFMEAAHTLGANLLGDGLRDLLDPHLG